MKKIIVSIIFTSIIIIATIYGSTYLISMKKNDKQNVNMDNTNNLDNTENKDNQINELNLINYTKATVKLCSEDNTVIEVVDKSLSIRYQKGEYKVTGLSGNIVSFTYTYTSGGMTKLLAINDNHEVFYAKFDPVPCDVDKNYPNMYVQERKIDFYKIQTTEEIADITIHKAIGCLSCGEGNLLAIVLTNGQVREIVNGSSGYTLGAIDYSKYIADFGNFTVYSDYTITHISKWSDNTSEKLIHNGSQLLMDKFIKLDDSRTNYIISKAGYLYKVNIEVGIDFYSVKNIDIELVSESKVKSVTWKKIGNNYCTTNKQGKTEVIILEDNSIFKINNVISSCSF